MPNLAGQLIDTLKAQAESVLGGYGDDLAIRAVLTTIALNLDTLEDRYQLPALLISMVDATEEAGNHGDGLQHVDMAYGVRIVAVAKLVDEQEALRAAWELRGRILAFLRNLDVQRAIFSLTGDDGEVMQRIDYRDSAAAIYGKANESEGPYLAQAGVRVTLRTAV